MSEQQAVEGFLSGDRRGWDARSEELETILRDVAERGGWPAGEAAALARYYLKSYVRRVAHILVPVADGRETLATVLTADFDAFAKSLWRGLPFATKIVDQGDAEALRVLVEAYGETLAAWLREHVPGLTVQDSTSRALKFLAKKLVLRPRQMLSAVGADRPLRPLRPRLIASLGNYLVDEQRPPAKRDRHLPLDDADQGGTSWGEPPPPPPSRETWQQFRERVAGQLEAIRQVPLTAGKAKAAHRQALLLQHRLLIFDAVTSAYRDAVDPEKRVEFVERLVPWLAEEEAALIGDPPTPLRQAWRNVARGQGQGEGPADSAGDGSAQAARVAAALGISENLYSQWLSRGRKAIVQRVGAQRHWFLFREAAP